MDSRVKYRILVGAICVILLTVGIFLGFNIPSTKGVNNNIDANEENIEDNNQVEIYPTQTVSTKKYDIEVVYIDYYSLCNEAIQTSDITYDTTLEDLKKAEDLKQKEKKVEYKIEEESNERLVYKRTINQNCPNHFKIILEEGKINIYTIVNETVSTIYQTIDVPTELIRPELLEELTQGIKVDNKNDLNLLIEDIES